MELNKRQQMFVEEYLVDLNATQAAIRAGYSERTANQQASRLLANVKVSQAIAERKKDREQRTEITQDRVLQELAAMALYDPGELGEHTIAGPEDIAKLPEQLRRCIVGWSWDRKGNFTLKLADKTAVVGLAMRHLGMLRDRVDHTTGGEKLPANAEPAIINVTIGAEKQ